MGPYRLVVEGANDVIRALLALKDNLGDNNGVSLDYLTARYDAANWCHCALDIRGRCSGRKVLRHHSKRPREAPDGHAPVERCRRASSR